MCCSLRSERKIFRQVEVVWIDVYVVIQWEELLTARKMTKIMSLRIQNTSQQITGASIRHSMDKWEVTVACSTRRFPLGALMEMELSREEHRLLGIWHVLMLSALFPPMPYSSSIFISGEFKTKL